MEEEEQAQAQQDSLLERGALMGSPRTKRSMRRAKRLRKATPGWTKGTMAMGDIRREINDRRARGEDATLDHIVPLKHKLVCGLHCPDNSRIIPEAANLLKGNKYWPDMP